MKEIPFRVLSKFNICKILLGNLLSMIINKYIPNLLYIIIYLFKTSFCIVLMSCPNSTITIVCIPSRFTEGFYNLLHVIGGMELYVMNYMLHY